MRKRFWLIGLFLGLLAAAPAPAQVVFNFGGANPTQIVNQPVATPASAQSPIAAPQQRPNSGFSLTGILSRIHLPSASLIHGTSPFPTPDQLPGKAYLSAFGFSRPAPIQP